MKKKTLMFKSSSNKNAESIAQDLVSCLFSRVKERIETRMKSQKRKLKLHVVQIAENSSRWVLVTLDCKRTLHETKFHLISWCGNFVERHKISTPGNQVKLWHYYAVERSRNMTLWKCMALTSLLNLSGWKIKTPLSKFLPVNIRSSSKNKGYYILRTLRKFQGSLRERPPCELQLAEGHVMIIYREQ